LPGFVFLRKCLIFSESVCFWQRCSEKIRLTEQSTNLRNRFPAADFVGERIAQTAEANGLKILATGDGGGLRNITNNVRPITSPDDLKGLKMRTPPITSIIKIMEALGANPVSIPYAETYMALKTGVADGQENPFINIATMKFHEVQKYMTVVNYQFHPETFPVSLTWFNG